MLSFKQVNKPLIPMKAHYFLWNAGTAPVVPFLSTYARQLGFSSVVVGLIYTILPIAGMIAKPIAGAIADRFKCQKVIFLLSQLLTAAAFISVYYSPEVPIEKTVHFSCTYGLAVFDTSPINMTVDKCIVEQLKDLPTVKCELECFLTEENWKVVSDRWNITEYQSVHPATLKMSGLVNDSWFEDISNISIFRLHQVSIEGNIHEPLCPGKGESHISTQCQVDCLDNTINDLVTKPSIDDEDVYGDSRFWTFLLLMVTAWVGQAISVSIGDAICFEMLGDKPHRYGYQRLFGALGWGIFSPIAGVMVDALSSDGSKKNFISAFYLAAAFLLLDFVVSYRIQFVQKKISTNIIKDVGRLLVNIRILVFIVWCIFVGMCTGLIWQFLFWLMEDLAKKQGCDSQNWIKTLEGLVMAIDTLVGEIPFFFLSGKIFKKIGHVHSMTLILLVIGIRYIIYSVVENPWWFLPVALLNGITFGLAWACIASYASIVAPPGTEATMQGMIGATFEGIGVSLGSFVGGVLYKEYKGPLTFRIFGIASLVVCLLHAAVQFLLSRKKKDGGNSDYEASYTSPKDDFDFLDDDEQELNLIGS